MSLAEQIQFHVNNGFTLALHGKKESLVKILDYVPCYFAIEMHSDIRPEEIIGHTQFFDDGTGSQMVPPSWYSEFCSYCKEHAEQRCALVVYGITKCECSKQVYLNSLLLDRKLRADFGPLPDNSSVILLVENKENAEDEYHNLTNDVFRRCDHIFLDKYK